MTAPGTRAWLDGLDQAREARAPRWWERCGCHDATGEFPDASTCHQVGICAMRQHDRQRDDDEAALVRAVRAVLDLADRWQQSADQHNGYAEAARGRFDLASELVHGLTGADLAEHADALRAAVTAAQDGAGQ